MTISLCRCHHEHHKTYETVLSCHCNFNNHMALLYYTTREAGTTYCAHKYIVDSNVIAPRMQAPTSLHISCDGDGGVEGVAVLLVVVNCEFDTRGARPLQMRQLLPQHLVSPVFVVVVSGVNLNTGVGGLLVRDDITPSLVVVDAQCDQEEAARGVPEAQHSGSATAAHVEGVLAIHLAPVCSIGVMPTCLLHNAEPVGGLGLDDPHVDGVRHGDELKRRLCGK